MFLKYRRDETYKIFAIDRRVKLKSFVISVHDRNESTATVFFSLPESRVFRMEIYVTTCRAACPLVAMIFTVKSE